MAFQAPGFAWAFLALPLIVILYLLKVRHEDRKVSSTLLWRKSLEDSQARRPLQKLRKHILLPLQLLCAACLVLCLMHPYVPSGNGHRIFVFDLSASMQAMDGGKSRLDLAREDADSVIQGMGGDEEITLLTAGREVRCLLSRSTDRAKARQVLAGLRAWDGTGNVESALSLAESLAEEVKGSRICLYTDRAMAGEGVEVRVPGGPLENRYIRSLTLEEGMAYVSVGNSGKACSVTVRLYGDDRLMDARKVELDENGTRGVVLRAESADIYRAEIREGDALERDNVFYAVKRHQAYTAAMNFDSLFLRSVLQQRGDLKVLRTGEAVEADLYIQGPRPLVISREIVDMPCGEETVYGKAMPSSGDRLFEGLNLSDLSLKAYVPLLGEGERIWTIGEDALMLRTGTGYALGFDLKDSNLPVRAPFPVVMARILEELLPEAGVDSDGQVGSEVRFSLPAAAENLVLHGPEGEARSLAAPVWTGERSGLYELRYLRGGEEAGIAFALRVPEAESLTWEVRESQDGNQGQSGQGQGRDLLPWVLILLLVLIVTEWGVACRVV